MLLSDKKKQHLISAQYTQSFSYDNQDRLTSSSLGSYSYDDPAHLHAATFVDSGSDDYIASDDASGNMLTRAPSKSLSQQKLSHDNEGWLIAWQNAPSCPTSYGSAPWANWLVQYSTAPT